MKFKHLIPALLSLFDGEGGAAAAAGTGAQGDTTGGSVPTRRGKSGEYDNVKFGKQPQATDVVTDQTPASDAGKQPEGDTITTSNTLEERRKAYESFKGGEYKDLFAEDVQKIINRRFSETKTLEDKVGQYQPIIDLLSQRFNVKDDPGKLLSALESDTTLWKEMAEEAGMDTNTYMKVKQMEREIAAKNELLRQNENRQKFNEQLQRWAQDAEALKGKYKSFDLNRELQNPTFSHLLKVVPMEHAYKMVHFEEIMGDAVNITAAQTEKKVVDNVRAKGNRPAENGAASQSAFTVKDDPSKWSKRDRAEIAKRVARGETIYL